MTGEGARSAIGVFGSANMDIVVRVDELPRAGETIFGDSLITNPGGKGLNQAVAAARAGGQVEFIGTFGTDGYGDELAALLDSEGIGARELRREGTTGTAHIAVERGGENTIVVVSGANLATTADQVTDALLDSIGWLVSQLELDLDNVFAAFRTARTRGVRTVLTPAPARPLADDQLATVDLLVPNQHEACLLAGETDPLVAAAALSRRCADVVVTLGADGAAWARGGEVVAQLPSRRVEAVDATAAGDTFVGALVAQLAAGTDFRRAIEVAQVAASITVTRPGAADSMPRWEEIATVLPGAFGTAAAAR